MFVILSLTFIWFVRSEIELIYHMESYAKFDVRLLHESSFPEQVGESSM